MVFKIPILGIHKPCGKTIPQSASLTAPFTQGSLRAPPHNCKKNACTVPEKVCAGIDYYLLFFSGKDITLLVRPFLCAAVRGGCFVLFLYGRGVAVLNAEVKTGEVTLLFAVETEVFDCDVLNVLPFSVAEYPYFGTNASVVGEGRDVFKVNAPGFAHGLGDCAHNAVGGFCANGVLLIAHFQ